MPKHDDTAAPVYRFATREEWLQAFISRARPKFEEVGKPLPEKVRVSVGFTSTGNKGKRIGECWHDVASADGHFEIFLKPSIATASRMADILTHELVHAACGIGVGHGPAFKKTATALGLGGKMTSTVAKAEWYEWALPILDDLGPMPYGVLQGGESTARPKQKTSLLKCECDTCGFTARITAKWINSAVDNGGGMRCPDTTCDGNFQTME